MRRSPYLAGLLRERGYDAKSGGIGWRVTRFNPFAVREKDFKEAGCIVTVDEEVTKMVRDNYELDGKTLIELNVLDPTNYCLPIRKWLDVRTESKEQIRPYIQSL